MTTERRKKMEKGTTQCELCEGVAMMYCDSDQASLCWECDAKVHGANFLVARHTRRLLCRRCQSPTPWRNEGAKLGPADSVCDRCCGDQSRNDEAGEAERQQPRQGGGFGEELVEEDDDGVGEENEEDGDDDESDEDEDGENQVVPWASIPPPPPPASSSSSEDEESFRIGRNGGRSFKRAREDADPSQGDLDRSSPSRSRLASLEDEGTSLAGAFCPWANRAREAPVLVCSTKPAESAGDG